MKTLRRAGSVLPCGKTLARPRAGMGTSRYEAGQMVVELCVTMPVVLMVAVVVVDALVFTAAASKFEHLSSQAVIAVAAAPAGTQFDSAQLSSEVRDLLVQEMDDSHIQIDVSALDDGSISEFTCKMSMAPWPLGKSSQVMGMTVPVLLEHELKFAVRPYVIGKL